MFVKENPGIDHAQNDSYSPDPDGPMNNVSWYDAAAYCNWLSRREGLPECYEPNEGGKYAAGMKIKPDALRLQWLPPAHRGGMGVCLPGGGRDQPLLRGESGLAGAVRLVQCHVTGPRLALW